MRTIAALTPCMLSLILAATAHAQAAATTATTNPSVELDLSDNTMQLSYRAHSSTLSQKNSEAVYGIFLSEARDVVGSAGLLVGTELDRGPLHIKLGPQAYVALLSDENNDVFALALGIEARYNFVSSGAMAVVASAYYSPDVLTFGTGDNLKDFMARGEMRLGDRLVGVVGYRWFEIDQLEQETLTLQNQLFVGARYQLAR